MELLLAVLIAAYAVKGVGADVAAAVAGKTPPSVLKWEARQKRRARPKKDPGYLGRIWGNALESWADASTRRHNRRLKARDEWEKRKGPEWVEKKLVKLEKAAARRERFAEKAGVLWGKAREIPENIRERRREDQAWEANARFDAERDDTVPAGLAEAADLEDDDQDGEAARVLPFRPRTDTGDTDAATPAHDPARCAWGEWEGAAACGKPRFPGRMYCEDHEGQHQQRCTWGEDTRCRKPRLLGSLFCPEHHVADPDVQAAVESTVAFERYQGAAQKPGKGSSEDELAEPGPCRWGVDTPAFEQGKRCEAARRRGSRFCDEHAEIDREFCRRVLAEGTRCRQQAQPGAQLCHEHLIDHASELHNADEADEHRPEGVRPMHETNAAVDLMTCLWGAEDGRRCTAIRLDSSAYCGDHTLLDERRCSWEELGDGERCTEPVHGRSPFCFEHHTADPELQEAIEQRWGRPQSDTSPADQPAAGGQDNTNTETKEDTPMPTTTVPAEITSLTDAITYTQAMRDSLAAVDAQVDQWSADLKAFAEKARAAYAEVETAIASLRDNEVEGSQPLLNLESAREQLDAIARVFNDAAKQVGAASDSAQAGASAFGAAYQAFTAQTGIQEQMQAAAASGNRAGKREFYEAG